MYLHACACVCERVDPKTMHIIHPVLSPSLLVESSDETHKSKLKKNMDG